MPDSPDQEIDEEEGVIIPVGLPNEILLHIAEAVAPNGGRKAGVLRLVNRKFARLAAPLAWSSLSIPREAEDIPDLLRQLRLARKGTGPAARTTSMRYGVVRGTADARVLTAIRNMGQLKRLHIVGEVGWAPPVLARYKAFRKVVDLHLERVNLSKQTAVCPWANTVESLTLSVCVGVQDLAKEWMELSGVVRAHSRVRRLEVAGPHLATPATRREYAVDFSASIFIGALLAFPQATEVVVRGYLPRQAHVTSYMESHSLESRAAPIRLTLVGPTVLYKAGADTLFLVHILNWVGAAPLEALTLPVVPPFLTVPEHELISLPNLKELLLDAPRIPVAPPTSPLHERFRDLMIDESISFHQLIAFLNMTTLPLLEVVRLRGWVDGSGAATLALPPPQSHIPPVRPLSSAGSTPVSFIPRAESACFLLLLDVLRKKGVNELRIENSVGHPSGNARCIFTSSNDKPWEWRIV